MAELCKFYKKRKYVSYDSGNTWSALNEYEMGELYEYNSPETFLYCSMMSLMSVISCSVNLIFIFYQLGKY